MLEAKTRYQQSLALFRQEGDKLGEAMALTALSVVAAAQGRAERAGRLLGAAKALSPLPANFFSEASRIDMDQDIAQARAHLDQAAFEAGWAAGQAMTQEQAISYALQDD
jgi:hypothetical protein